MHFEVDHRPELALADLQMILRSDEQGYGSIIGLRAVTAKDEAGGAERMVTRTRHSDEFPNGDLILRLMIGDERPPAPENAEFIFKGTAMIIGVESKLAAYRSDSFET